MREPNDDDLIHPETTSEVKWIKVTPETRDKLLVVYFDNMEQCSEYQEKDERMTAGEAAILWMFDNIKAGDT